MNLRILSPTTVRATCLLLLLVAVRGGRQEAQKPRYDSYSKAKELSCGAKFTAPMEGLTKDKTFPCKFTKSILGKWEKAGLKFGWYKMVKGSPTKNQIMRIYTKYNDYPTAAAFVLVLARPKGGSESSSCNWAVWQRSKHDQPLQFHGDGKSTIYIGVAGPGVDGDFVQGEVKCLTAAVNDNFEDAITSSCGSPINVPAKAVATNDTLRWQGYSEVPTNNYPCDTVGIDLLTGGGKATDATSWLWYKFPEGKFATGAEVTFTGPGAGMVVLGVKSESNYRSKCVHAQREISSTGTLKFVAAPKTVYFLGLEAAKDAFSVSVECETKAAPPNDNYANAIEQACGVEANTVSYETSGATVDTKFPCKWDKSILAEEENINKQYVWVKLPNGVPSNQQVVDVGSYHTIEYSGQDSAVILAKPKGGSEKSKCSMALRVKWDTYFQGDENTDVYIGMSPNVDSVGTPISLRLVCPQAAPNNNYKDAIPVSCGQEVPDVSGVSTSDFLPPDGYSLVPTNNLPCKVPVTLGRDSAFKWYRLAVPKNTKVTIKERTDWSVFILGFKEGDEDDFDKKCALVNPDIDWRPWMPDKPFKTKSGYKYLIGWTGQNKISVTCTKQ